MKTGVDGLEVPVVVDFVQDVVDVPEDSGLRFYFVKESSLIFAID